MRNFCIKHESNGGATQFVRSSWLSNNGWWQSRQIALTGAVLGQIHDDVVAKIKWIILRVRMAFGGNSFNIAILEMARRWPRCEPPADLVSVETAIPIISFHNILCRLALSKWASAIFWCAQFQRRHTKAYQLLDALYFGFWCEKMKWIHWNWRFVSVVPCSSIQFCFLFDGTHEIFMKFAAICTTLLK